MDIILIIDDQPHLHELFSEELKDEGYIVDSVGDIDSARRYFKNSKPDLVLLDLYLKGFEGWDLLHDIKIKYPHLPVIITTAYDSYVHDPRVSKADGYVVKNLYALDGLKQKIAEFLEKGTLERGG